MGKETSRWSFVALGSMTCALFEANVSAHYSFDAHAVTNDATLKPAADAAGAALQKFADAIHPDAADRVMCDVLQASLPS